MVFSVKSVATNERIKKAPDEGAVSIECKTGLFV
jgi:hypothetical protein